MTVRPAESVCDWCGDTFPITNLRGQVPIYCCHAHRQAAYAARQTDPHVLARKLRRLGWTVTPPEAT